MNDTERNLLEATTDAVIELQQTVLSLQASVARLQATVYYPASAGSMALVHVSKPLQSGKEN